MGDATKGEVHGTTHEQAKDKELPVRHQHCNSWITSSCANQTAAKGKRSTARLSNNTRFTSALFAVPYNLDS